MITYAAVGLIVLAALYLGWDWLSKNVKDAVDFHSQDSGVTPVPPMPEPFEIKPSRLDALRKLEWLREYYQDSGMDDSLRCANHAAKAMFADDPAEEEQKHEQE